MGLTESINFSVNAYSIFIHPLSISYPMQGQQWLEPITTVIEQEAEYNL